MVLLTRIPKPILPANISGRCPQQNKFEADASGQSETARHGGSKL
ncbi:hypothetical protein [Nibribacter ruber]|nr:hypothetical protein [Nibribacter ruber]